MEFQERIQPGEKLRCSLLRQKEIIWGKKARIALGKKEEGHNSTGSLILASHVHLFFAAFGEYKSQSYLHVKGVVSIWVSYGKRTCMGQKTCGVHQRIWRHNYFFLMSLSSSNFPILPSPKYAAHKIAWEGSLELHEWARLQSTEMIQPRQGIWGWADARWRT